MFCLICAWINGWVNNREVSDLRHYRAHYDVTVMQPDVMVNIGWAGIHGVVTQEEALLTLWGYAFTLIELEKPKSRFSVQ